MGPGGTFSLGIFIAVAAELALVGPGGILTTIFLGAFIGVANRAILRPRGGLTTLFPGVSPGGTLADIFLGPFIRVADRAVMRPERRLATLLLWFFIGVATDLALASSGARTAIFLRLFIRVADRALEARERSLEAVDLRRNYVKYKIFIRPSSVRHPPGSSVTVDGSTDLDTLTGTADGSADRLVVICTAPECAS